MPCSGSDLENRGGGPHPLPGAFVVCSPVPPRDTVVRDPIVVFEALSDSTSRIEKLREYGATPSIQHYVILEQNAIAATVFVRKGTDLAAEALTAADTCACRRSTWRCRWPTSASASTLAKNPPRRLVSPSPT
jgi:hypothetical protein